MPLDPALERARADEVELHLSSGRPPAPSIHRVESRPMGVAPVPLLGGLAMGALLLAIILFVAAGWLAGIGLLVISAGLFGLLVAAIQRQPDAAGVHRISGLVARARDFTTFLLASGRTWTRTGVNVISLRWRRRRLARELRRRLTPLGEAVHQSDGERLEELKAEAADVQRQLDEAMRRESALLTAAQSEVERQRAPVQATEVFEPVRAQTGGTSPRPGE